MAVDAGVGSQEKKCWFSPPIFFSFLKRRSPIVFLIGKQGGLIFVFAEYVSFQLQPSVFNGRRSQDAPADRPNTMMGSHAGPVAAARPVLSPQQVQERLLRKMSTDWLIDKYDYLMLKCAPWQKIQIQFDTYFLFFTYIQSRLQSCLILIAALTKTSELAHKLAKKLRKELARRGAYFTETDPGDDV